ncbi:MAG: hypothetical protein ACP5N2_07200 [Candidatus Nanoarchaeia archaeon]
MKNKNKIVVGIFGLFIVSVLAFAGLTYAYRGDATVQGPNYDADVHEQLELALENNDYDAWLKIRQDNNLPMNGRMFQVINKDNFEKYAQMHEANEEGDYETANAIRAELGLGQGMMKRGIGQGNGKGMGTGNSQAQGSMQGAGQRMQSGTAGAQTCGCTQTE